MKNIFIDIIKFYRKYASPGLVFLFGRGCRFTPTCSEYTIEALEKFGAVRGVGFGIRRLLRCHPFGGSGYDPIKIQ